MSGPSQRMLQAKLPALLLSLYNYADLLPVQLCELCDTIPSHSWCQSISVLSPREKAILFDIWFILTHGRFGC